MVRYSSFERAVDWIVPIVATSRMVHGENFKYVMTGAHEQAVVPSCRENAIKDGAVVACGDEDIIPADICYVSSAIRKNDCHMRVRIHLQHICNYTQVQ